MLADRRLPIVLLVEDDQCLAQVLCRVLARSGYEIEWAANVADAVRELERAPAVGLLDLHLPDGNGVDLAELLRARYPDMPMLLMTGCPIRFRERPEDAKYFRQVLLKPLELLELRQAISAALNEGTHAIDITAYSH